MRSVEENESCEHCLDYKKNPITICGDCDREYIMVDVQFYRQLREGKFVLKNKIKKLEERA